MSNFFSKCWAGLKIAFTFGKKYYEENPETVKKIIEEGKKIINKE